jgi:dienelactone hydrolase
MLEDTSRPTPAHGNVAELPSRVLPTEVWYPTAPHSGAPLRDAEAARGRFPLVLNSHGYSDIGTGEAYYAEALASRGYVVASPQFPLTNLFVVRDPVDVLNQPGDVRFVLDTMLGLAKTRRGWLAGRIDRHKIGATGLSYGGLTTLLVTFHPTLRDPRIRAALPIAPAACALGPLFYRAARPPLLMIQGTQDLLLPIQENAQRAFDESVSARELVRLVDASHTAFTGLIPDAGPTIPYDAQLGCPVVVGDFDDAGWQRLSALDDPANGISIANCSRPCQQPFPSTLPMPIARQRRLTQATVVAFFESTLRRSHGARCFLKQGILTIPDVQVESAPGHRLPRGK